MGMTFSISGFSDIRRKIEKSLESKDIEIGRKLTYMGEEFCAHARTISPGHASGGYDDQTGNLRSSIGFRIYRYGELYDEGGFDGTAEGQSKAKEAIDNYDGDVSSHWTLVVTAGMEYAVYVEAKGYNVLHLTSVEMNRQINELKKQLRK